MAPYLTAACLPVRLSPPLLVVLCVGLTLVVCWLWGCADARGMSKGIGFARFEYTKSATAAIDDYHNKVLCAQRPVCSAVPLRSHTCAWGPACGAVYNSE